MDDSLAGSGVLIFDYYQDEDALVMWATDIDTPEYAARIAELRASVEEGMS